MGFNSTFKGLITNYIYVKSVGYNLTLTIFVISDF